MMLCFEEKIGTACNRKKAPHSTEADGQRKRSRSFQLWHSTPCTYKFFTYSNVEGRNILSYMWPHIQSCENKSTGRFKAGVHFKNIIYFLLFFCWVCGTPMWRSYFNYLLLLIVIVIIIIILLCLLFIILHVPICTGVIFSTIVLEVPPTPP